MSMFGAPDKSNAKKPPKYDLKAAPDPDLAFIHRQKTPGEEVKMSDTYARAMAEYEATRAEAREMRAERDDLHVQLSVVMRENARLHSRIEQLEESLEVYRKRIYDVEAKMDDAAAILLRIFEGRMSPKDTAVGNHVDVKALEHAATKGETQS
jgi:predicted  nucleic acid-binding Zn-ribbon protein